MSDRLAVFNEGRIEQVGAPGRRLRAAGDPIRRRLRRHLEPADRRGRQDHRRRRRHVHRPAREDPHRRSGCRSPSGRDGAPGRSARSSISGRTRAITSTLDAGGGMVVTQQNLATTSTEALAQEGRAVRLIWKRQHDFPSPVGDDRLTWRRRTVHENTGRSSAWPAVVAHASPPPVAAPAGTPAPSLPTAVGAGEGELEPDHLGRLRRARRSRPELRLGHAVRGSDRLQGQHDRHDRLEQRRVAACSRATTTAARSRATRRAG